VGAHQPTASTPSARRARALLLGPDGRRFMAGVVLIALVLFGQDLAGRATAGNRLDAALRGAQDSRDVIVVLAFTPERFHSERLAQYGVFAGRAGGANRVRLRMVSPDNLRRLANIVWVARVEPLR
jgi:hypothetical protein